MKEFCIFILMLLANDFGSSLVNKYILKLPPKKQTIAYKIIIIFLIVYICLVQKP